MNTETLLTFPCSFPIKIMGLQHDDLITEITAIVARHSQGFNATTDISTKLSRNGKYLSVTVTITAKSKQQLDQLYQELNQHHLVKLTL